MKERKARKLWRRRPPPAPAVFPATLGRPPARPTLRKLPVIGVKDWLLIYEDDLFLLAVKDAYDEVDIRVVD